MLPCSWAFSQRGGGSPFRAGEAAVKDGGVTAGTAALEHAGCCDALAVLCPGTQTEVLEDSTVPQGSLHLGLSVLLCRAEQRLPGPARGCNPLL